MQIGSKVAIYKCELIEPPKGNKFYKAVILENVSNNKNIFNKWETVRYNALILDTSIELEPAKFDLDIDKNNKHSFNNISNPEKSLIRVYDFGYDKKTEWWGRTQKKDENGKPKYKEMVYLNKIGFNYEYKSENKQIKELQNKIIVLENKNNRINTAFNNKLNEFKEKITDLKSKNISLKQENKRLERIIDSKEKKLQKAQKISSNAREKIKSANRNAMVFKRRNTIISNQLSKTNTQLEEKKQEIKEVKRMKKEQIIKQVESEDIDFNFSDI